MSTCVQLAKKGTLIKIIISPNFLEWKFCGKAHLPHSFGQITRNSAETVPFYKISHHEIR